MVLWDVIWQFECKIYLFMVNPISFNNSWHALLSECICPYVNNMGSINCCNFFKLKFHWILVHKTLEFIWLCWVLIKYFILKSPIIIMGQEIGIRSKNFWKWILNIDKDNVQGLFIVIIQIVFLVFALNVVVIYSALKMKKFNVMIKLWNCHI